VIESPSEMVLERVRGEIGLNELRMRETVEHLKDWLQLQPHLPPLKKIGTFLPQQSSSSRRVCVQPAEDE
jgi:hypothetical protein